MSTYSRGRKPALKAAPEALVKAPPAPKHLSRQAKAEWKRVMPQLIARQTLTKADLGNLEAYCAAVGASRQIAEKMAEGELPDLKLGGLQIRYSTLARQLAAEFGLTPVSRQRLGTSSPAEDDDDDNPLAV